MYFGKPSPQLAPRSVFARRIAWSIALSTAITLIALAIGVGGYHWIGELNWIDSLLNASMILGGMGPVDELHSDSAKVFASIYALLCGLVLVTSTGIVFAPILHRLLHSFHLDDQDIESKT